MYLSRTMRYCTELSCANRAPCKEHRPGFGLARIVDVHYLVDEPAPAVDWQALLAQARYGPKHMTVAGSPGVGFAPLEEHKMIKAAARLAVAHPDIEFAIEFSAEHMCTTRHAFHAGKCVPVRVMCEAFKQINDIDYANLNAVDAVNEISRICTRIFVDDMVRMQAEMLSR